MEFQLCPHNRASPTKELNLVVKIVHANLGYIYTSNFLNPRRNQGLGLFLKPVIT